MSSNDRIEKFLTDSEPLLKSKNLQKIFSESQKLSKWLQKHQDETVTDASKQKLFSTIQSYQKFAQNNLDPADEKSAKVIDAILDLCEDFCKMPEGKLVAGRSAKTKAMKWIESLQGLVSGASGGQKSLNQQDIETTRLDLIDLETRENTPLSNLVLMDGASGQTYEVAHVLEDSVLESFNSGASVVAIVDSEDFSNIIEFDVTS